MRSVAWDVVNWVKTEKWLPLGKGMEGNQGDNFQRTFQGLFADLTAGRGHHLRETTLSHMSAPGRAVFADSADPGAVTPRSTVVLESKCLNFMWPNQVKWSHMNEPLQ